MKPALLRACALALVAARAAAAADPPTVAAAFAAPLRLSFSGFGEAACASLFGDGGAIDYTPPPGLADQPAADAVLLPSSSFELRGEPCRGDDGFRVVDIGVAAAPLIAAFIPAESLLYVYGPERKDAAGLAVPVCGAAGVVDGGDGWASVQISSFRALQIKEAISVTTPNVAEGKLPLLPDIMYLVTELFAERADGGEGTSANCLLVAGEKTGGVTESAGKAEDDDSKRSDSSTSSGLASGAIIGIVVGVIALVACLVALLTWSHVRGERARAAAFPSSSGGSRDTSPAATNSPR